jgi:hypothetical protein
VATLPPHDPAFTPLATPDLYSIAIDTTALKGIAPYAIDRLMIVSFPVPNLCEGLKLENALKQLISIRATPLIGDAQSVDSGNELTSEIDLPLLRSDSAGSALATLNVDLLKGDRYDQPQGDEAKLLKDLVLHDVTSLAFAFSIVEVKDAPRLEEIFKTKEGGKLEGGFPATLTQIAQDGVQVLKELIPFANVAAYDHPERERARAWKFNVEVTVTASNVPGCDQPVSAKLKTPTIIRLSMRLPTLVAGFDKTN